MPQKRIEKIFSLQSLLHFFCFFCLFLSLSCATSYNKQGKVHTVRRGENIWSIAKAYRVEVQDLAEYNNIQNPDDMLVGMDIAIPEREKKAGYKKLRTASSSSRHKPSTQARGSTASAEEPKKIHVDHNRFSWPIGGVVVSGFGLRGGRRHDGVDLKASIGTPIKAAGEGRVAFSGKMRGYGNLILIRHTDDYFTAYAHNKNNVVKKDQKIKSGQVIAYVGRTGRTTGPHLHFEVRKGTVARNPLFFLPKRDK